MPFACFRAVVRRQREVGTLEDGDGDDARSRGGVARGTLASATSRFSVVASDSIPQAADSKTLVGVPRPWQQAAQISLSANLLITLFLGRISHSLFL